MAYLTENQIHEMADAAANAYEFNASRAAMFAAAKEYAADEFGVKATPSQLGYAVKLATTAWVGHSMAAKAACA